MLDPETLPAWLTEQDIDYYTSEFERTGFSSGLNWYRTIDKSWELMAAWTGAPVRSPASISLVSATWSSTYLAVRI